MQHLFLCDEKHASGARLRKDIQHLLDQDASFVARLAMSYAASLIRLKLKDCDEYDNLFMAGYKAGIRALLTAQIEEKLILIRKTTKRAMNDVKE